MIVDNLLRAPRNGKLVEFAFADGGEISPGVWHSTFMIEGKRVRAVSDSTTGDRFEHDLKVLEQEGFSGPLELSDGQGGWSTLGVIGGKMSGPVNPMLGLWSPSHSLLPPTVLRPPMSLRPGSLNSVGLDHKSLPRWLKPDPKVPDTMGWRAWVWHAGHERLVSPHHTAVWDQPYLGAAYWADGEGALRGSAGIHARLVPRHWKIVGWPDDSSSSDLDHNPNLVTGIVERFGRYVLGTEGWRAEQVIIRELMAPSTEIGLALERVYPDVIVHYPDQLEEGDLSCKSVKSSELEKGNRSALPLLPRSPAPPSLAEDEMYQQAILLGLSQPPIPSPPLSSQHKAAASWVSAGGVAPPPDLRAPVVTYTYDDYSAHDRSVDMEIRMLQLGSAIIGGILGWCLVRAFL